MKFVTAASMGPIHSPLTAHSNNPDPLSDNSISTYVIRATFFLMILVGSGCTKPPISCISQIPTGHPATTDTLTISGFYRPANCRVFFDVRLTAAGELLHDDTVEPTACDYPTAALTIAPCHFPVPGQPDLHGLRIILHQHLLLYPYRFSSDSFQASHLHRALYNFAAAGKQILQLFFPDSTWQQLLTSPVLEYEFSFQLVRATDNQPTYTLLQGHYDPATDLVKFQHLPDLHPDNSGNNADSLSSSHADSYSSSVQFHLIDSLHTLRIRSIYHLLPEDFAIWNEDQKCSDSQNYDLRLLPASCYNLLDITVDPPYLDCLLAAGSLHFQIALLK